MLGYDETMIVQRASDRRPVSLLPLVLSCMPSSPDQGVCSVCVCISSSRTPHPFCPASRTESQNQNERLASFDEDTIHKLKPNWVPIYSVGR